MIISINGKLRTSPSAPTLIGSFQGRSFYENPWQGDEAPLMERIANETYIETEFWELEDCF